MNRGVNQRPQIVTQLVACALILLMVSGCSLFGSTNSLSAYLQSDGIPDQDSVAASHSEPVDVALNDADRVQEPAGGIASPDQQPAAPSARLLNPEFQGSSASDSESSGGHSLGTETGFGMSDSSLYPTTIRPISRTRELFEAPEPSVPPSPGTDTIATVNGRGEAVAAVAPESQIIENSRVTADPVSVESPVTDVTPPAVNQTQPERSMLERLREFAPDRRTGNLLRRQIQRIPSPWDLLPGREATEEPVPPPVAPRTAGLEVTPTPAPDFDISTADTAELLRALIAALETELNSWPQTETGLALQPDEYRRRQLNLRLLRLIDDEPAAAAEAIDLMSPEEQEFWQELILGISQFRNPDQNADYEQHIADTIGQLKQAVQQLEPLSSLRIRRLEFCTKINNFGAIETFPTNTFEPAQRLLIYGEVENLQSDVSPPPLNSYRTSFTSQLEIWSTSSESPEQLHSWPIETVHDDSSTRRSDYFLSYEFNLPLKLASGSYEVRLQVHDDISGRTAHSTLEFVVQ